jgi:hypothetical protein
MEKKKTRFGQAIVADGVSVISPDHNLDTLQLLQLQRGIETFTLSSLSNHDRHREKRPNLKLVKFCIVKQTILIGVAQLEYPTKRFNARRLERLETKSSRAS